MLLILVIWEEEDNISIDSNIPCVIFTNMPSTIFANKKNDASEAEVALELASELSSNERGDVEVVEAKVVDFIDDYANDEYTGTFESPPSNRRRCGKGRAEKGGNFNEAFFY